MRWPDAGAAQRAAADHPHSQGRTGLMRTSPPAAMIPAASASATSCWKVWRPTVACTCPSLPAGRRRHADPLARPAVRRTGVRDPVALHRRHPGGGPARSASAPTPQAVFGTPAIVPLRPLVSKRQVALAKAPLVPGGLVQRPDAGVQGHGHAAAGQPVRIRTGPPRRTLNILGATSGDTGSAAEYAMRGKRACGVHDQPAGA
jgi:hypothetical protein